MNWKFDCWVNLTSYPSYSNFTKWVNCHECEPRAIYYPTHNDNLKSYQWCLTKKLASTNKISNGHMEICVATAPVRNFCEWMCSKYFLEQIFQKLHTKEIRQPLVLTLSLKITEKPCILTKEINKWHFWGLWKLFPTWKW